MQNRPCCIGVRQTFTKADCREFVAGHQFSTTMKRFCLTYRLCKRNHNLTHQLAYGKLRILLKAFVMKSQKNDPVTTKRPPTYEEVHRDISLANNYRLEFSKILLTITAGVFAFTVAFPPTLNPGTDISTLKFGWYFLAASMAGGLGNLYGWERFYISYRDYDLKSEFENGRTKRKQITRLRRLSQFCQVVGFVVGSILIGDFTASNIQYRSVTPQATTSVGPTQ